MKTLRRWQRQKAEHVCGKTKLLSLVILSTPPQPFPLPSPSTLTSSPVSTDLMMTDTHVRCGWGFPRLHFLLPTALVNQAGIDLTHLSPLSVRPGYSGYSFLPPDWLSASSVHFRCGSFSPQKLYFLCVACAIIEIIGQESECGLKKWCQTCQR